MIIIRIATKQDKTAVLSLLDELLTYIDQTNHGTHEPVPNIGGKLFDEVISSKTFKIFLAEEDNKPVGLMTFFIYPVIRRGHWRGQIEDVIVTESMRRKGVGKLLLNAVQAYCKNNHISTFRLNSGLQLKDAHNFYEQNGGIFTERMYRFDISY